MLFSNVEGEPLADERFRPRGAEVARSMNRKSIILIASWAVVMAGCVAHGPVLTWTGLPRPLIALDQATSYRYQPLAVLWPDGTLIRLGSPSRLVRQYYRGRVPEEALEDFVAFLLDNLEEIDSVQTSMALHMDARGFFIWLGGVEHGNHWLLEDKNEYSILEEVVHRMFTLPMENREPVMFEIDDGSFVDWLLP